MIRVFFVLLCAITLISGVAFAQEYEEPAEEGTTEETTVEKEAAEEERPKRTRLFSISFNVGGEGAVGYRGSTIEDMGIVVGGSIRYFSPYIFGIGVSVFEGDHDPEGSTFNDASVRGGVVDIYAADHGKVGAMYIVGSIGSVKETFYYSTPGPSSFQQTRTRVNGLGGGFFIYVGRNFALGTEYKVYNLRESPNTDLLRQFLFTINSTF